MDIEARLLAFLRSSEIETEKSIDLNTPLLDSGILDSLGLFKLVLWIETETNTTIDFTVVDTLREWNTVSKVAGFIRRQNEPRQ